MATLVVVLQPDRRHQRPVAARAIPPSATVHCNVVPVSYLLHSGVTPVPAASAHPVARQRQFPGGRRLPQMISFPCYSTHFLTDDYVPTMLLSRNPLRIP